MNQRLNTDQLIQNTREGYDAIKFQQRIKELQLTLELRNKELEYLGTQLMTCKEENKSKVNRLERELVDVRRQLGEIKVKQVREIRTLQEDHQAEIKSMREEHSIMMEQRQKEEEKKYQNLMATHRNHISSLQQKYDNYIKFQKEESKTCKTISQEQSHSLQVFLSQVQEEKKIHLKARKDAEHSLQMYKVALQKLKEEHSGSMGEKDEAIARLRGEVEGLKLKERFLSQKLDQMQEGQFQFKNQDAFALEQLKKINTNLVRDNENLKDRLRIKQEELFNSLNHFQSPKETANYQPYLCNHKGLIFQLEQNLAIKQKEIQQLRNIVAEWTRIIGFDQPLSKRLTDLAQKGENVENLNKSWLKKLQERSKKKKGYFR